MLTEKHGIPFYAEQKGDVFAFGPISIKASYIRPEEASQHGVEYIVVLGVEGVGHHGILELLRTALYLSGRQRLRNGLLQMEDTISKGASDKLKSKTRELSLVSQAIGKPIVPLIWFSYPCRNYSRKLENCEADYDVCFDNLIKKVNIYNPQWMLDNLGLFGASVKFILLDRSFPAAVWSHKVWDGGVAGHGRVISMYKRHLRYLTYYLIYDN